MTDLDAEIRAYTASLGMPWEALVRVGTAIVASGIVGLERELRGRRAGLRTTILISVGAALAMIVSISFAKRDWPHGSTFDIGIDPARVAYSVMTGIGLLCAGTIIKEGASVHGMTTAAGLWCVAALGLSAGLGLYLFTIVSAVLVVGILWLLQVAENFLPRIRYAQVIVRRAWEPDCIAQTISALSAGGLLISDVNFTRTQNDQQVEIELNIGFTARSRFFDLAAKIENHPDLNLVAARNL